AVRDTLARLAEEQPNKLIFIDSRRHLGRFACGTLKGNRSEILTAAGLSANLDDEAAVRQALAALARKTSRAAFCTMSERGIMVAPPSGETSLLAGYQVSGPIDIVGAGDSAPAGIVTALLAGAGEIEAAALGNLVASI